MEISHFLRESLEIKIKTEWDEKWSNFGPHSEDKLNRRTKFYEALALDITKVSGVVISRDTAMRFCNEKGGESQNSLLAFAKYLGFTSLEALETELSPKKETYKIIHYAIYLSLSTFFIITIIWYIWYWIPTKERLNIIKVIEDANQVQFEMYRTLELKDSLILDNFYTKMGSAKKAIITVIKQNSTKPRRINLPLDNPSFYKIFTKQVLTIDSDVATVKTTEHWFLKWYNIETNKYEVSYDVKNEQFYELMKQDGRWKIDHNFYEGKASRIDY